MQLSRRPAAVGLVVAAVVAALLTLARPASAAPEPECNPPIQGIILCVSADSFTGTAYVYLTSPSNVPPVRNFHSPTIALEMCAVGPSNCGTAAARSDVGHVLYEFATSEKPYSPGHIYRAHGSWISDTGTHYVDLKTAFTH